MPKPSAKNRSGRGGAAAASGAGEGARDPVASARAAVLEGVGREVAASFPGITRLGGQIVAALYLADDARSMDDLSEELGRSKSNVFANLRALEAAGIVERRRVTGARSDAFALRGKYPDVVVGAYLARLRRVVADKVGLCTRALDMLGDARGREADALRGKLGALLRKYERFATAFELVPFGDGPIDLEELLDELPQSLLMALATTAKRPPRRAASS
ncbi:MAG: MarR family transcriptional regulator [Labilithrix sp.]|nr:MarR family transcriptional regulator [Labilithrix sp.]MCW5810266.1 MarR family transcriptional regulator [Labilithrix sp.]